MIAWAEKHANVSFEHYPRLDADEQVLIGASSLEDFMLILATKSFKITLNHTAKIACYSFQRCRIFLS